MSHKTTRDKVELGADYGTQWDSHTDMLTLPHTQKHIRTHTCLFKCGSGYKCAERSTVQTRLRVLAKDVVEFSCCQIRPCWMVSKHAYTYTTHTRTQTLCCTWYKTCYKKKKCSETCALKKQVKVCLSVPCEYGPVGFLWRIRASTEACFHQSTLLRTWKVQRPHSPQP